MVDLAIIETGNGGDIQLVGNDLAVVNGIENMPYLGMFGGNVEQSTVDTEANEVDNGETDDWWGNNLFSPADQSRQMNSKTEKILRTTPLTSAGRIIIQNAIKEDLDFLKTITGTPVNIIVSIVATDRLDIQLQVTQLTAVTIVKLQRLPSGDFSLFDFNNDFFK